MEGGKIYNNNKRWLNEDEPTLYICVTIYKASVTVMLPGLLSDGMSSLRLALVSLSVVSFMIISKSGF